MNCALIAFTRRGAALALKISSAVGGSVSVPKRMAGELGLSGFDTLQDWVREHWHGEALIFVGACGIAVRGIAPFVRDKFSDPAVVVTDEAGQYVVSLLSGHVGGGNGLANHIASIIGAQPVVSTATDVNGLFAVDVWARERNLQILDRKLAKMVSATVLEGKPVGFRCDFETVGTLPKGLSDQSEELTISVTDRTDAGENALLLAPKSLILGIGCRKNTPCSAIESMAEKVLTENRLLPDAVGSVVSIDLKKAEPGLLEFCEKWNIPLHTYSADELNNVQGNFHHSDLVQRVTGVDNVCERAAVCAGGGLIVPKQAEHGVTVAVARKNVTIYL